MRVLLVKTSSMGDLIHTLPALTDAAAAIPEIRFDWVVEEPFKEIPPWHPNVERIIPVALRRWRKQIFSAATRRELKNLYAELNAKQYDIILDAQGLVKSCFLTFLAQGERVGLDWKSARESLASLAYQRKCTVNFYQHAIVRMRSLFSQALCYPLPQTPPEFALKREQLLETGKENYLVFLHGTTWKTKEWPKNYWVDLAKLAATHGYRIKIGGGNHEEVQRAHQIATAAPNVDVMPYMNIVDMAKLLANANGVVAVDTGFGHLAAALDVPTVSLYGATNPVYTGALGRNSVLMAADFACAPCLSRNCKYTKETEVWPGCYSTLKPEQVWRQLLAVIPSASEGSQRQM